MTTHNLPPHSILHYAIEDAKGYINKSIHILVLTKVLMADLSINHKEQYEALISLFEKFEKTRFIEDTFCRIFTHALKDEHCSKFFVYTFKENYEYYRSFVNGFIRDFKDENEILERAFTSILSNAVIQEKVRTYMKLLDVIECRL